MGLGKHKQLSSVRERVPAEPVGQGLPPAGSCLQIQGFLWCLTNITMSYAARAWKTLERRA